MSSPFDIKKDPSFIARVKKIESAQYAKILKKPLKMVLDDGREAYIKMIGINDSYLIVIPLEELSFNVLWTKSDGFRKPNSFHGQVSTRVINWTMLESVESDVIRVKHGSYDITKVAIETMQQIYGKDCFKNAGPTIYAYVQETLVEIKNPFHR